MSSLPSQTIAARGPLFASVASRGPIDWSEWEDAAAELERSLPESPDRDRRIHHLYLPILFLCRAWRRDATRRPLLVGVQAPQGAGKTTLVSHLVSLLKRYGQTSVAVSIDDFYLTRDQQIALAAAHAGNPYLEHRGYPGTHDAALGERTIDALSHLDAPGTSARVPVYDKSRHGGRGDRLPESEWRDVRGPLDIVFVEGWMLGYTPIDEHALVHAWLVAPNRSLAEYARWHAHLDAFIAMRAINPRAVLRWRVEAEDAMRARGLPALDRAAIEDYIRRFLPAYHTWGGVPAGIPAARQLTVWIDDERRASDAPPNART